MSGSDVRVRSMTERELLDAVVEIAARLGWLVHHDRPAANRRGQWATHIQGDPGFPDLILVRPPRIVVAELKRERGVITPQQRAWLEALASCGIEVHVWKPTDWLSGAIEAVLHGAR